MIIDIPRQTESQAEAELPDYATLMRAHPPRSRSYSPLIYTFSEWIHDSLSGSMLLMPPPEVEDQRPLYKVTAELDLNPLLPVSYVTKIHRAGTEIGELVGEFSISLNNKRAVLRMGDTVTRLSNVLYTINSDSKHWNWTLNGLTLRWDCRTTLEDGSPMCICFTRSPTRALPLPSPQSQMIQLAVFIPPPTDASPPLPSAQLTVFPQGQEFLDDIIISALAVERKLVMM